MEDKLQVKLANDILQILYKNQLRLATISERLNISEFDTLKILTVLISKSLIIKNSNETITLTSDGKNFCVKKLSLSITDWKPAL